MLIEKAARQGLMSMLSISISLIPLFVQGSAYAQSIPTRTAFSHASAAPHRASSLSSSSTSQLPLNLDLSSTEASLHARNTNPVIIQVGGTIKNGLITGSAAQLINPGQLLTPAQFMAVYEVLLGRQTLLLSKPGQAIGGFATIASTRSVPIDSVVVPANVLLSAIGYNASNPLNVKGSVNVMGSFCSLQRSLNVTSELNLGSLNVDSGGLFSGNLPRGLNLGNGIYASRGMTLNVRNDVTNMGGITTPGNLNIKAGGSINNSLPAGFTGTSPIIQAAGDLTLISGSGSFVNAGTICATTGSINLASQLAHNVVVNNTDGTLKALAGKINVTSQGVSSLIANKASCAQANTLVVGGDLLTGAVNVYSGSGSVTMDVGRLTGPLNISAAETHVTASTDKLVLGKMTVTGDPTYYNTTGSVIISEPLVFSGNALAIVANTDITTTTGTSAIDTSSASGNGGAITLVAGANFTSTGGDSKNNDPASTLTITSGTSAGGKIDLSSGTSITSLTSSSTASNGKGGDIILIAYGGSGSGAGKITLPAAVPLTSGGNGNGMNGNVSLIAGANTGTAISMGAINTTGGTGGGGNISLSGATPVIVGASEVTITDGAIMGSGTFAAGTTQAGAITSGTLNSAGNISVATGTNYSVPQMSAAGDLTVSAKINIAVSSLLSAANIVLQAGGSTGNISMSVTPTASASLTLAAGGSGSITQTGAVISAPSITLSSGSGNIGTAIAVLRTDAVNLSANTGGTGKVYINEAGTVNLGSSSAGNTFDLTVGGDFNLSSPLSAPDIAIRTAAGSNGSINLAASPTASSSLTLTAAGSGSITQTGGTIISSTITLSSTSGNIGTAGAALKTDATTLTATTSGSGNVYIFEGGAVSLGISKAGATFDLTAGGNITTASLKATDISLRTTTASNGSIKANGITASNSVTLAAGGSGNITGCCVTGAPTVTLSSDTGNIGAGVSSLLAVDATNLYANTSGTGTIYIENTHANTPSNIYVSTSGGTIQIDNDFQVNIGTCSGGKMTLNAPFGATITDTITATAELVITGDTITINNGAAVKGATVTFCGNGSVVHTNMLLSNSGTVQSTTGGVTIVSTAGQNLTISGDGSGQFIAPAGQAISISAPNDELYTQPSVILGPGNQSFLVGNGSEPGGAVNITAVGSQAASVKINNGVTYTFQNDYSNVTVNTSTFVGDLSALEIHPASQNPHSTLTLTSPTGAGTIANSTGPIDLSLLSTLNFYGANLAILSASDIINSGGGPLTINLSGGKGGSLVLIAGFNFTPSTSGVTSGPDSTLYTLGNPTPGLTAGGSINLSNVNIDTSGTIGGGSVLAVAYPGTSPGSGAIHLGTLSTTGGSGSGGTVTMIGNSIATGAINTSASLSVNSGAVSLSSATSVTLSNPSGTQVNGIVTGGTFLASTAGGAISIGDINAGHSSVALVGGSIAGSGTVTASSLALNACSGNIGLLNTVVSNLTANAGTGSISINNTGSLASFAASAGSSMTLTNTGSVVLAGNVSGATVSITATGGSITGSPTYTLTSDTVTLTATGGNCDGLLTVDGGSLCASAPVGNVGITNTGNLANFSAIAGLNMVLTNNGAVSFGGDVVGNTGVSISLSAGKTLTTGANQISSTNAPVNLTTDSLVLGGSVSAGTGAVTITPRAAGTTIALGAAGAGLNLTTAQLNSITASSLKIGSGATTGGIIVNSGLSITAGYSLQLLQGGAGSFDSTAGTIAMSGGGDFTVALASGNINTAGSGNAAGITNSANLGTVTLQTSGNITLGTSTFTVSPVVAHSIKILAGTGKIYYSSGSVIFRATQAIDGNGGSIFLSASNLANSANLTVDVNGNLSGIGTGNGGTASLLNTSNTAASFATGNLLVKASGANAGTVIISSGGNLSIKQPADVIVAAATESGSGLGSGATISLTAGSQGAGALLISGSLSAAGSGIHGDGGSITLNSSSSTAFAVGSSTATNGISGSIDVSGSGSTNGQLIVRNSGGGIVDSSQTLTAVNRVTFDTTGAGVGTITIGKPIGDGGTQQITLTAGGSGAITSGTNLLTANSIVFQSGSGVISSNVNAAALTANTGGAASVSITNNRVITLNLGASSAGSDFTVTNSYGSIDTSRDISAGTNITLKTVLVNSSILLNGALTATNGTITLTATGSGTITDLSSTGTDSIKAVKVTLNTDSSFGNAVGTPGNALRLSTTSLAVNTSGPVNINNLGYGNSSLTVIAAKSTSSFSLATGNALVFTPAMTGATEITLNAYSGITVNGSLGNTSSTTAINLTTSGGNIIGSGTLTTCSRGTVTLTTGTGDIGTTASALKINTPTFAPLTPNIILLNVTDAWSSSPVAVTSLLEAASDLTFVSSAGTTFGGDIRGSSVTIKCAGTATFHGNVSAATGAVSITQTGSGTTAFDTGADISAGKTISIATAGAASFNNIYANGGGVTVTTKGASLFGSVTATAAVSITQTGPGILNLGSSSAGTTLSVSTSGSGITTSGAITAPTSVILKNTGAVGSITLGGDVIATNSVTLCATGTGTITDAASGTDCIKSNTVILNTGTGAGNGIGTNTASGIALRVDTPNIAANSTGYISINNLGNQTLTLTGANPNNQLFALQSASAVTINTSLAGASSVSVDTSTGNGCITLKGTALGGSTNTSLVTLSTGVGAITGSTPITTNTAGAVNLSSTSGSFGGPTPLKISTPCFTATTTSGNINISNARTGTVLVGTLSTTGSIAFASAGCTTFKGDIMGGSITLNTVGATTFNGNIMASSGALTLAETGTGTTNFNLSASSIRTISGTTVVLNTVGNTAFAPGTNITSSAGSISITETTGMLAIGGSSVLKSAGTITLLEKANTSLCGINIGDGSSLSTLAAPKTGNTFPLPGQISLVIGTSVPTSPIRNQAGKSANTNVVEGGNPNYVYWGSNSGNIVSNAPVNNLTITGNSAIVFAAGTAAKITLSGSTTFDADPPVGSAAMTPPLLQANSALRSAQFVQSVQTRLQTGESIQTGRTGAGVLAAGFSPAAPLSVHPVSQIGPKDALEIGQSIPESAMDQQIAKQARLASNKRIAELSRGNTVFAPLQDTLLPSEFGQIEIGSGSVVLVASFPGGMAVYDLDDQRGSAVRIHAGNRTLVLSPGRQAVVTRKEVRSFDIINPIEEIGYRYMSDFEIGGGLRAFSSEFSVPSAINAVKPLRQILLSRQPDARKLGNHLLKTMAAITQINPNSERYQQMMRPRMNACLQQ